MSVRKRLPIGIQTFAKIRQEGHYYVDKTPHVLRLIDGGKYYFLNRPYRSGRSLLFDTMGFAAERVCEVMDAMLGAQVEVLIGLQMRVLNGNWLDRRPASAASHAREHGRAAAGQSAGDVRSAARDDRAMRGWTHTGAHPTGAGGATGGCGPDGAGRFNFCTESFLGELEDRGTCSRPENFSRQAAAHPGRVRGLGGVQQLQRNRCWSRQHWCRSSAMPRCPRARQRPTPWPNGHPTPRSPMCRWPSCLSKGSKGTVKSLHFHQPIVGSN